MFDFEIIVIGSGHNSLTTACYLSKSGMNVGVFEKQPIIGGAVQTEDMFNGYKMDVGGSAHFMIHQTPVVKELELEKFGLEYIDFDPWAFYPTQDGKWFAFYKDLDKTCQSISKICEEDADNYYKFIKFWDPINEGVFEIFLKTPTAKNLLKTMFSLKFGKRNDITENLRKVFSSYGQYIKETFKNESIRSAMTWLAAQSGPPPTETASADFAGWQSMIHKIGPKRPKGGSGMLTQSMGKRLVNDGGKIFTSSNVKRVIIENNKAIGIELLTGESYFSKFGVVSGTHVVTTIKDLVGSQFVKKELTKRVDNIKVGNGFGMVIRCASNELPNYIANPSNNQEYNLNNPHPSHTGLQLICPSTEYLDKAYGDYLNGISARNPAILVMTFSAIDDSLSPKGKHTCFIWSQYHPYKLSNNVKWSDIRENEAIKLIDKLSEYAPNMKNAITDYYIQTPLDIEEKHGMINGNVMHVEMSFDQMFIFRPTPSLSDYTTPIKNLYLTGASMHPGGGIFAASGYNAAKVVIKKSKRNYFSF